MNKEMFERQVLEIFSGPGGRLERCQRGFELIRNTVEAFRQADVPCPYKIEMRAALDKFYLGSGVRGDFDFQPKENALRSRFLYAKRSEL